MDGIVSTLAGPFVVAQASLGQTSPVGWEDFIAILPALVLLAKDDIPKSALEREVVIDETRRSYRLTLDGIEAPRSHLIAGEAAVAALRAVRNAGLLLLRVCHGVIVERRVLRGLQRSTLDLRKIAAGSS